MQTKFRILIVFLLFSAIVFFVCNKDQGQRPAHAKVSATSFGLAVRATVGEANLKYDSLYHLARGRAITITDFRYYISNIKAIRDDGTEQQAACGVVLVNPDQKNYDFGTIPAGSYKGLKFTIGLDSNTNHGDPTVFNAGNPLAIQTPSMHWDWNSGYLFMKIEGKVDTTAKCSGSLAVEFFYHLGMDTMKRVIEIPVTFSVQAGKSETVRLKVDLARMLNVVDMRHETATHSFDNVPLARKIADSWQASFSLDQ